MNKKNVGFVEAQKLSNGVSARANKDLNVRFAEPSIHGQIRAYQNRIVLHGFENGS
jgi:hypothetical protein